MKAEERIPTKQQLSAAVKGDADARAQLMKVGLMPPMMRKANETPRAFQIRYPNTNYFPYEVIGPMEEIWKAEGLKDRVVADVGSGIGATVLMLSKNPLVRLAVGFDNDPECIRFSKLLAAKYANNPEVLSCLTSGEGIDMLSGKYNADALGARLIRDEPFQLPSGSMCYPDHWDRPVISSRPSNVPIGDLIEVLEWNGAKPFPPTPQERRKMLFVRNDWDRFQMPSNSADAVICIDSAHWEGPDRRQTDPVMEEVLRMAKKGALLHIHSRRYSAGGRSGLAQDHLKRIVAKKGAELEDLGPTFLEASAGMCHRDAKYHAHLFRVKRK